VWGSFSAQMPFSEQTKLEAKRRAHFSCVICHQAFVEIHHIVPQAEGGSDDLENAAPLCARCHDLFGANPDKRKQLREMKDLWWELCENNRTNPDLIAFNQKLDAIQVNQRTQSETLAEIKDLMAGYHLQLSKNIALSGTISEITGVTGVYFGPQKR